ncbi:MAG: hypothetical protein R3E39_10085 [Anaerolineae bacterium]
MASNNQNSNEMKRRFDIFHHEARFQDKPYRLLGKPQITNKHVSILFAFPDVDGADGKTAFIETVVNQLKEYGLEAETPVRQKTGVRIQARLLDVEADEKSSGA